MKRFDYSRVRLIVLVLLSSFVLCNPLGHDAWAGDPFIFHFNDAADGGLANGNGFDGYALRSVIWPRTGDTYDIPVCWENYPNRLTSEKENVRQALADTWERYSFVRFVGWGQCNRSSRGIRIRIRNDTKTKGGYTKGLGTQLDGLKKGMVLNLKSATLHPRIFPDCKKDDLICSASIAVHEFGHALGFAHEQNRSDRKMGGLYGCIQGDVQHDPQGPNGNITIGSWDIDSILNYCNPHWHNEGRLSLRDIATAQFFYDDAPRYDLTTGTMTIPAVYIGAYKYKVILREIERAKTFTIEHYEPTDQSTNSTAIYNLTTGSGIMSVVFVELDAGSVVVAAFVSVEYDPQSGVLTVIQPVRFL